MKGRFCPLHISCQKVPFRSDIASIGHKHRILTAWSSMTLKSSIQRMIGFSKVGRKPLVSSLKGASRVELVIQLKCMSSIWRSCGIAYIMGLEESWQSKLWSPSERFFPLLPVKIPKAASAFCFLQQGSLLLSIVATFSKYYFVPYWSACSVLLVPFCLSSQGFLLLCGLPPGSLHCDVGVSLQLLERREVVGHVKLLGQHVWWVGTAFHCKIPFE